MEESSQPLRNAKESEAILVKSYGEIQRELRKGFIIKVYSLLFVQLALTFFFVYLANEIKSLRAFILYHSWLYYFILLIPIAVLIYFVCDIKMTRKVPINYILLFIFTIGEGYTLSRFTLKYSRVAVYTSMLLTLIAVITLTLFSVYALKTGTEITLFFGLFWVTYVLIIFALFFIAIFRLTFFYTFLNIFVIIIMSFYILIDTQLIIGNKTFEVSLDDYILGVIILYLDIINLFIYILAMNQK